MKLEGLAEKIMASMLIANPHHLKKAMRREGHSGYVYAQKLLNILVDLGKLERRGRLYALPSCKSEGKEHALKVTDCIAELYHHFDHPIVYREKTIDEVGLRPDVIAFIKRDGNGVCFVLEVIEQESPEYLRMKRNVWETWNGATRYLTNLIQIPIKHFDVITSEELTPYLEFLCAN